MKKFFTALLLLTFAMIISVGLTGCANDEEEVVDENEDVNVTVNVRIYDAAEDENVDVEVLTDLVEGIEELTINDVVEAYLDEYVAMITDSDSEANYADIRATLPDITGSYNEDLQVIEVTFDKILENMGSGVEGSFIENLAYTLKSNFDDVQGITLNVNGEEYASGHLEFSTDEIITGEY